MGDRRGTQPPPRTRPGGKWLGRGPTATRPHRQWRLNRIMADRNIATKRSEARWPASAATKRSETVWPA